MGIYGKIINIMSGFKSGDGPSASSTYYDDTGLRVDINDSADTDIAFQVNKNNPNTNLNTNLIRILKNGTGYIGGVLIATGSGFVNSIAKSGSTALTGAVTLTGGTSVTLTQVGQDISIAASGASGGTPAVVLGTATAAGVSATFVRDDDTIIAFDVTVPVTQAMGDSAATGSVALASRRDHKHGMPALGTTAAAIGTSAGGSAVTPSKSDHVHATGAGTPSTQAFGDSPTTGTGPAAAMTDHKHGMPAAPAGSGVTYTNVLWSTAFSTTSATYVSVTNGSISVTANHASNKIVYTLGNIIQWAQSSNFSQLRIRNTTDSVTIAEANIYNANTATLNLPFTISGQVTQATSAKTVVAQVQSDGTTNLQFNPQTLTNGGHLQAMEVRSNG